MDNIRTHTQTSIVLQLEFTQMHNLVVYLVYFRFHCIISCREVVEMLEIIIIMQLGLWVHAKKPNFREMFAE